ncbi:hypothetical protein EIP91_011888 [Steccherinum ochraceum]|uniref:Protein kinase domain-containing protein n=1 Tax=Steccherinum ochraceum TaxID=92696 RepID=A0A4R0RJZ4_9APHY|nr:hypothetical protein EIP91_011888 [Steccherinum ochraceum]
MSDVVEPRKPMPSNAFATVVLPGVASSTQHPSLNLLLRRHQPLANTLPYYLDSPANMIACPSQPTHLGHLRLSLSLGQIIGSGAVSRVYEATVIPSGSSSSLNSRILPPLVVKISRRGMGHTLLPEAQNYVEMATLQGHVIPRCYGLYSATIPDGIQFRPWEGEDGDAQARNDRWPFHSLPKDEGLLASNIVTILVLERLGEALPLGTFRTDPTDFPEIQAMYTDMSTFGVVHHHMATSNIVKALDGAALPVLTSPNWTKPYQYRLIDFHESFKVNIEPSRLAAIEHVGLERLLNEA